MLNFIKIRKRPILLIQLLITIAEIDLQYHISITKWEGNETLETSCKVAKKHTLG